jgi:hypothetical protein
VARFYAAAAPFVLLAALHRAAWIAVPVAGLAARTARTFWRKRNERWGSVWNPLRWLAVALILLILDAATFAGMFRWMGDRLRGRQAELPAAERGPA